MSEYELARQQQIEKNKAMLASLNISELTNTMTTPKKSRTPTKEKKRKFLDMEEEQTPRRRSTRIAGIPATVPPPEEAAAVESEDKRRVRRDGDFTLSSATSEHNTHAHTHILASLARITFDKSDSPKAKRIKQETPKRVSPRRQAKVAVDEDEDKENIENRDVNNKQKTKKNKKTEQQPTLKVFATGTVSISTVTKTVQDRIYTVAMHPSNDRIVVVSGDSWGRIGIWNYGTLEEQTSENDLCVYKPHCAPVSTLLFPVADSSKLYSCSYDGAVRCADLYTEMFTQLNLRDETRTCLDVDPASPHLLFVGSGDGVLSILDTRTPKVSEYEIHSKKIHTVSVNPGSSHFIATASNDQTMCVWDIRKMKTAVHTFKHQQAVTSCGFSKKTGKYLVSFSYDNHIRIFENYKEKAKIDHNCNTGRWITPFKVAWDPKVDNIFACVTQLADEESLTAIPSINAFHQYHNVMVSGTASGRTYIWK